MKWLHQTVKLVGTGVLACCALGCVEQEASLGLRGVVEFSGAASSTDVTCGDGGGMNDMGGPGVSVPTRTCERQSGGGNVENYRTRLGLNIPQFDSKGQRGAGKGLVTKDEYCAAADNDMLTEAIQREFFYSSFNQWVSVINRLDDSTTVRSTGQGGGGGGGGFEGLQLNVNDIQVKQFKIRFPNIPETKEGQLGLDANVRLATIIESEGGAGILEVTLFNQSQSDQLKALHRGLVMERNRQISNYNEKAKKTPVTLIADIVVEGETIGEQEVESNHLEFPIELCNHEEGCAVTTPRCNFRTEGG